MHNFLEPIRRESVRIFASLQSVFDKPAHILVCPHCERELDERHEVEGCRKKQEMPRRLFLGLLGASSAALAARLDGIPLPEARVQVTARAGDMFEVMGTDNPFTIAYEGARTIAGNPFRDDSKIIRDCGILNFHPKDVVGNWLRVHPGIGDMHVLGVRDSATGKPVKYRVVRSSECDKLIADKMRSVMVANNAHPSFAQGLYLGFNKPPDLALLTQESQSVERKGVGRAKVKFPDAVFEIKYEAGEAMRYDKVTWSRKLTPLAEGVRTTRDGRAQYFAGSLHGAIEQINIHWPGEAALLRRAIMDLNPEHRQRTGVVALQKLETPAPKPIDRQQVQETPQADWHDWHKKLERFAERWRNHPSAVRWARGRATRRGFLAGPKGMLPA